MKPLSQASRPRTAPHGRGASCARALSRHGARARGRRDDAFEDGRGWFGGWPRLYVGMRLGRNAGHSLRPSLPVCAAWPTPRSRA